MGDSLSYEKEIKWFCEHIAYSLRKFVSWVSIEVMRDARKQQLVPPTHFMPFLGPWILNSIPILQSLYLKKFLEGWFD